MPLGVQTDSWIAIGWPPWLTALARLPIGGTYCTGGCLPDARSVFLGWLTLAPDVGVLPEWLGTTRERRHSTTRDN